MSELKPTLPALLEWVQALVVHPCCPGTALLSDEAQALIPMTVERLAEVLVPSATLAPIERIAIYANMYPLRMRDALGTDYPVLIHALGEDRWKDLVDGYIQLHPSRHPNLNQLGLHLPEYVRSRTEWKDRGFLAELAELELAMTRVFDAEESPALSVDELAELPPAAWGGAIFRPIAALQLRSFQYPVNAYLQAVKDGRHLPPIRRQASYVVVYRKKYVVWRMGLTPIQYRILRLLSEGKDVGTALLKGAKGGGSDAAGLARELRRWFGEWVDEGFFTRIEMERDES